MKKENTEMDTASDLINTIEQLEKETAEQWLRLDKPVQGEIMAVMVMTAAFDYLKEKVSDPFNAILNNAKSLFPSNSALKNIEKLDLGPPDRNFDTNDIPLVSAQFEQALEKMDQLKKTLSTYSLNNELSNAEQGIDKGNSDRSNIDQNSTDIESENEEISGNKGFCEKCGVKVSINYGDAYHTLCEKCA